MSEENDINNNEEDQYSQYKENKYEVINSTYELNKKMNLSSIENEKNEKKENNDFNTIPHSAGIEVLKQKIKDNNNQDNNKGNKNLIIYDNKNLEKSLQSYILANKSKEQKILDLLEIINQYEIQIVSLTFFSIGSINVTFFLLIE